MGETFQTPKGERRGGGGWDLESRITEAQLTHACPECTAEYRKATS